MQALGFFSFHRLSRYSRVCLDTFSASPKTLDKRSAALGKRIAYCACRVIDEVDRIETSAEEVIEQDIPIMPYMYIIKCSDGTYYTGSTWHLKKRIEEHNEGKGANYTRCRLPVELVYSEYFGSIKTAFARENQVKRWGRKKKEALIRNKHVELPGLAKKVFG